MISEVLRGEIVEAELNRLVERRAKQASKANAEETLWAASARRHDARLREERLRERRDFHQAQLQAHTRTFEKLLHRHRTGLRLVEQELGITHEAGGDPV